MSQGREILEYLLKNDQHTAVQIVIAKFFRNDEKLVDKVIKFYLQRSKKDGKVCTLFGGEEFLRAKELLRCGPSMPVREAVLARAIFYGYDSHAEEIAYYYLHRNLTEGEVKMLIEHYTQGASKSDHKEEDLCKLARGVGGTQLENFCKNEITKMHTRWEDDSLY